MRPKDHAGADAYVAWLRFGLSAVAVVAGGILAAVCGDVIAVRTGLGRFLFGTVLLAAGTSLPELISAFTSVSLGLPNLAAGNLLGSSLVDIFFLGVLDLFTRRTRLLHQVAITHSLTASLGALMVAAVGFFILVPLGWQVGPLDLEGLALVALFVGGLRVIQLRARIGAYERRVEAEATPRLSLWVAILGFAGAAALLLLATPVLVGSANAIAIETGLGAGFIGVTLLALTTNIPDLVSSIAAVRIDAYDLAVGNLFGTTVFDMFVMGLVSLAFPGSLFSVISPGFVAVGLLLLMLTNVALFGTLANLEWHLLRIDWDAALIILIYLGGNYLLYRLGLLAQVR
jgi:cation:H+ antiporter